MEITRHEPGMFSWADLATPDTDGSRELLHAISGVGLRRYTDGRRHVLHDAEQGRKEFLRTLFD